ncbi:MAG: fimbrillin family protein, partial [Rikenellaceae bacterium]
MKRKIFSALMIGAVLLSCSKDPIDPNVDVEPTDAVSIAAMIQSRATELSFESGDQIGVSIVMDADNSLYADNSMLSYNGSSFTGDLYWYTDADLTSTILAYYPYVEASSTPTSFTIQEDQTESGAYTASDLMMAMKSGVEPSSSSTTMTFSHSLSRIVVEVDNQSSKSIESVVIGGSYPTAIFDLAEQSVEVDATSAIVNIKAPLWDDGAYKAIIVPQTVALTFTITFDGGEEVSRKKASVTFVAGGEYTAEITVLDSDIDVDLSGDVDDWTEGGVIPDVSFDEYDGYFVYDGVTYQTVTFSNGATWMAEPLRYLPDGYTLSSDATEDSDAWYPYAMDYDKLVEDDAVVLSPSIDYLKVLTDEESIAAKGLLYSFEAALGKELTEENC